MVLALAPWFGPVDSGRNRLELWTSVSLVYITPSWDYTPYSATLTLLILVCFLYGLPLAQAQGCLYPAYTPRFRSHSSRIRLDPRTCRCTNPWYIYIYISSPIFLYKSHIQADTGFSDEHMSVDVSEAKRRKVDVLARSLDGAPGDYIRQQAWLVRDEGDPACFTGSLQGIGWSGRTIR